MRASHVIAPCAEHRPLQTGIHEPLVDMNTWQQVQRLLDSRKKASERQRTHDHYLKGTL